MQNSPTLSVETLRNSRAYHLTQALISLLSMPLRWITRMAGSPGNKSLSKGSASTL